MYLESAIFESAMDVPDMQSIDHITGIESDRLWVGGSSYTTDKGIIKQVDISGNVIETINDVLCLYGNFAITQKGELLYLEGLNKVQKKTLDGTTTIITTPKNDLIESIFSSKITEDLLVGVQYSDSRACKLTRYDKTGAKIQDIETDKHRQTLCRPIYIAENKNGDIVIVNLTKKKVVVVDKSGAYRNSYKGQYPYRREFSPRGICTDVHGHIMVVDFSSYSIHLLDQDLHFLTLLLTEEQHNLKLVSTLFADEKHNLYVGSENGRISVYKYLKDV